jgi:hypothetical protein
MSYKKTILFLSANPKDSERKRFDEEFREIEEGLRRSKFRDNFKLEQKFAVRSKDIRRALLDFEPEIVHFCTHGEKDGLKIEDQDGSTIILKPGALSGLFELFKSKVQCVILNAGHSESQANAIKKHIDYVIGMKQRFDDAASIEFTEGFYDALGAGKTIEEAFKFGRVTIQMNNHPEYKVPTLKKRTETNKKNLKKNINPDDRHIKLAIRSFKHYAENFENKVDDMLCLCDLFKDRQLVKGTWEDVKNKIEDFISKNIKAGNRYDLHLPLHSSLAFLVGRMLDPKCGAEINIFQSSPRLNLWPYPQDVSFTKSEIWNIDEFKVSDVGDELAAAFSVSRPILQDVEDYVKNKLPDISNLLHFELDEIHFKSIKDANHAFEASYKAVVLLRKKYRQTGASHLNLFLSAPNVFSLMLGQHSLLLRDIKIYEYDFGSKEKGAYFPTITI